MPFSLKDAILQKPPDVVGPRRARTVEEEDAIRAARTPAQRRLENAMSLLFGAIGLPTSDSDEQPNQWSRAGEVLSAAVPVAGPLRAVKTLHTYNPATAAKTAVATTGGTYDKAYTILRDLIGKAQPRILDYGAGRGHGSIQHGLDSFEPFVESFTPTYRKSADIPRNSYEGLLNLNVLNVLPPELRREAVETMVDTLQPGGYGIISVRGRDVLSALKNPASQAMDEPMSLLTSKGTYQKGFTQPELLDYLRSLLGRGVSIAPSALNTPASAIIRKK